LCLSVAIVYAERGKWGLLKVKQIFTIPYEYLSAKGDALVKIDSNARFCSDEVTIL